MHTFKIRVQWLTGKLIPQVVHTKVEETTYNHNGTPSVKSTSYWRDAVAADLGQLPGYYRVQAFTGKLVLQTPKNTGLSDSNFVDATLEDLCERR